MNRTINFLSTLTLFSVIIVSVQAAGTEPVTEILSGGDVAPENGDLVDIEFYFNTLCGSCQKVLPFIQQYEANTSFVKVHYYNIGSENASTTRFNQVQQRLGNVHVHIPLVLIGDQYLTGQDTIIAHLDTLAQDSRGQVFSSDSPLREYLAEPPSDDLNLKGISLFYDPSCGSCQQVLPIIEAYAKKNPDKVIQFYDISASPTNFQRFEQIKRKYSHEQMYVPVLFIGDTYLQGEKNITERFEPLIEGYGTTTPSPTTPTVSPAPDTASGNQVNVTLFETIRGEISRLLSIITG
jgi:thiol-disulfide isomerase/thioredoxin